MGIALYDDFENIGLVNVVIIIALELAEHLKKLRI